MKQKTRAGRVVCGPREPWMKFMLRNAPVTGVSRVELIYSITAFLNRATINSILVRGREKDCFR